MTLFNLAVRAMCLLTDHEWSKWYRRTGSNVWQRHCTHCGAIEKDKT